MSVEATAPTADTLPTSRPNSSSWAIITALALVPIIYAIAFNVSFRIDENPADGPDGLVIGVLFVLKILTISSLAVGVHQIGDRIARRRSMAAVGAGIWSAIGVTLVVVVAWAKGRGASLGGDHLWPGQSDPELLSLLRPDPGSGWRPGSIVAAEVVAVIALSIGVAALLGLLARRTERLVVTTLALGGLFCGLVIYDRIVGWPVMFDFDPFVGDAVLGVLTYELGFFIAPTDPLGAIALAAIGLANSLILASARSLLLIDMIGRRPTSSTRWSSSS